MKRPTRQKSQGFSFAEDNKISNWQSDVFGRLEVRVSIFVLLVSFIGGCISCFIVYNRSLDQVFETHVAHVRAATASVGRSINPDVQQSISRHPDTSSKNYLATKNVLQHFLKTFPTAHRAYTVLLKNGKTKIGVDGGRRAKSGEMHHSARINQPLNSPSKELLRSFDRGTPQVERTPRSSDFGNYVTAYYPIKTNSGKVTTAFGPI